MAERTSSPENSPSVQQFLDRASQLLLDLPAIDAAAFAELESIGADCAVGREEFLAVLADLEARKVAKFVWRPPDWPLPPGKDEMVILDDRGALPASMESSGQLGLSGSLDSSGNLGSSADSDATREARAAELRRARRRKFQKQASKLIARHGAITPELRSELLTLGEELGMSRRQVESAIDKLARQRREGDQDTKSLIGASGASPPKPPPRPPEDPEIKFLDSNQGTNERERRDRVVPPPPPVIPPPLAEPKLEVSGGAAALPMESDDGIGEQADHATRMDAFRDEARRILAENRGMTARSRLMLADAAHDLGLSEYDFDEALASIGVDVRSAAPPPAPSNDELTESEKLRPEDSFRSYLRIAIADKKLSRGVISENAERKMINEGARKLRLSAVWAKQLLSEVAAQMDVPLESDQKPATVADSESTDPLVAKFTHRAAPILTQFRGLNAQSRIRLSALADELALTAAQREEALNDLQNAAERHDDQQLELREAAFREYIEDFLAELSHGILSPSLVADLQEKAELRFGVEFDRAGEIVRRSAEEAGTTTISTDQALRHVEGLIVEQVGASTVVMPDVRELLYAEAEQWGVEGDDVALLIKECCDRNRRRGLRERRTTNIVLGLACLAVATLFGGFIWVVIFDAEWPAGNRSIGSGGTSDGSDGGETGADDPKRLTPVKVDTWWDTDLQIMATNLRRNLDTSVRDIVRTAGSPEVERRSTAYEALAQLSAQGKLPLVAEQFLARCFAEDPDDKAAEVLVREMMKPIPIPGKQVPVGEDDVRARNAVDWLARTASEPSLSPDRLVLLQNTVNERMMVRFTTDTRDNQDACRAAYFRRVMENLVEFAREDPKAAVDLWGRVIADARTELNDDDFSELSAKLVHSLSESGEAIDWDDFDSLATDIVGRSDDASVLRGLLELSGESADAELREIIEDAFALRTGEELGDGFVDRVTERLGLDRRPAAAASGDEQIEQLREYVEPAIPTLTPSDTDVGITVQSILRASYMDLLATSLAVDSTGSMYGAYFEAGEERFVPTLLFSDVFDMSGSGSRLWVDDRRIEVYAKVFRNNRKTEERFNAFVNLARLGSETADIQPSHAEAVAGFLVQRRTLEQAAELVEHVKAISGWHNVRIAVGRALGDDPYYDESKELVVNALLGREFEGTSSPKNWGEVARLTLIESVVQELEGKSVASPDDMMTALSDALVVIDTQHLKAITSVVELDETATPADTARELVLATAARFPDAKGQDFVDWSERLPHEIAAIQSLQANGIQQTVSFDRLRLTTLAKAAVASGVDRNQVDRIISATRQADADAGNVMEQLVGGRVQLLKLAMLFLEDKEAA